MSLENILAMLDGGNLCLYSGPMPRTCTDPIDWYVNTLLVTMPFGRPAFGPVKDWEAVANKVGPGKAIATGIGSFYRAQTPNGDVVAQGPIAQLGVSFPCHDNKVIFGGVLEISSLSFAIGKAARDFISNVRIKSLADEPAIVKVHSGP